MRLLSRNRSALPLLRGSIANFLTAGVAGILARLISLVTVSLLIRALGPVEFGKIGFAETLVTYFMLVSDLGLQTIGLREVARIEDRKAAVWRLVTTILGVHLLCTAALALVLNVAIWFILDLTLEIRLLVGFYSIGLLFPYAFTIEWWLNGTHRLGLTGVGRLLRELVFLGLVLVLVRNPSNLLWAPISQGLAWLLLASLVFGLFLHETAANRVQQSPWSWQGAGDLLKRSWPIAVSGVISHLWIRSGVIQLGVSVSDASAGLYNAAWRIFAVGLEFTSMASLLAIPWFSRLYGVDSRRFRRVFRSFQFLLLGAAALCILIGGFFGDLIITLLVGEQLQHGGSVFVLLMVALGAWMVSNSFLMPLLATKFEREVMLLTGLSAVLCLILNLVLIPEAGTTGAALSLALSMALLFVLSAVFYWRLLGQPLVEEPVVASQVRDE